MENHLPIHQNGKKEFSPTQRKLLAKFIALCCECDELSVLYALQEFDSLSENQIKSFLQENK